jgi:hypothetical protein
MEDIAVIEEKLRTGLDENGGDRDMKNDKWALTEAIRDHSKFLHPNHYLMIALKRYLMYATGRHDPERLNLCNAILAVYDIICPGLTKERGLTLFEIHSTLLEGIKKQIEVPISLDCLAAFSLLLTNCINVGHMAKACLQFERPGTFEYMVECALTKTIILCTTIEKSLHKSQPSD